MTSAKSNPFSKAAIWAFAPNMLNGPENSRIRAVLVLIIVVVLFASISGGPAKKKKFGATTDRLSGFVNLLELVLPRWRNGSLT